MKKILCLILFSSCLFLQNSTNVYAEDNSSGSSSLEKSSIQSIDITIGQSIDNSESKTSPTSEKSNNITSLREKLLAFTDLSKDLINKLTDDQLDEANRVSLTFGNQDISGCAKFIKKMYGEDPVPEAAYSVDYSKMSLDEMKKYLTQIRLSLIYIYDLNEDKINSISDQELVALIDRFKTYLNDPIFTTAHVVENMANEISSGEYIDKSTPTSNSSLNSSDSESSSTSKEDILPRTGEKMAKYSVWIGILLIIVSIFFILINEKKKSKL